MESAGPIISSSPPPPNFADVFVRSGWRGVRREFGTPVERNRAWLAQCGPDVRLRRIDWLRHSPSGKAGRPATSRPECWKPCPPAFRETFIRFGWRGIEAAFGARNGVNLRWIEQSGGEELRQERKRYLGCLKTLRAEKARRDTASRQHARALHHAIPEGMPCL